MYSTLEYFNRFADSKLSKIPKIIIINNGDFCTTSICHVFSTDINSFLFFYLKSRGEVSWAINSDFEMITSVLRKCYLMFKCFLSHFWIEWVKQRGSKQPIRENYVWLQGVNPIRRSASAKQKKVDLYSLKLLGLLRLKHSFLNSNTHSNVDFYFEIRFRNL